MYLYSADNILVSWCVLHVLCLCICTVQTVFWFLGVCYIVSVYVFVQCRQYFGFLVCVTCSLFVYLYSADSILVSWCVLHSLCLCICTVQTVFWFLGVCCCNYYLFYRTHLTSTSRYRCVIIR